MSQIIKIKPLHPREDMGNHLTESEKLKKRLAHLTIRRTSGGVFIEKPEAQIVTSENVSIIQSANGAESCSYFMQDRADSDFHALYTSIKVGGIIQGSAKEYSADELIEIIKRVRFYSREKRGDYYDLNMITNTNGIRDRVRELIQKENTLFL